MKSHETQRPVGEIHAKQIRFYLFAYFTAMVILQFAYVTLDRLSRGESSDWQRILIEQGTGGYGTAVLLPLVLWTSRRYPFQGTTTVWIPHLLMLLLFSGIHTFWNWTSRVVLYHLLSLGSYEYGKVPLRFLMEFPADIITYSLITGSYWFYRSWIRQRDIESQLAMARLESLNRQLQPHFIFNALNTVSSLMFENIERADLMLEHICKFIRATMRLPDAPFTTIAEELAFLRQYLDIMQIRLEENLKYSVQCDSEAENIEIPALLLQPLIENAVKHGMDPISGKLKIEVSVYFQGSAVCATIRDHGHGIKQQGQGRGIDNTRQRLRTHYGGRAFLRLTNHPLGGALAEVEVPA